jgi:hypothetical protein
MVTSSRVRLRRVRPFISNGFAPQFEGYFVASQGTVALVGCFTMSLWTKINLSIWFGIVLLATLVATIAAVAQPGATPDYFFSLGALRGWFSEFCWFRLENLCHEVTSRGSQTLFAGL